MELTINTYSINVEGNFNLGDATRSRRNSSQLEFTQEIVVLGHGSLSFINLNQHAWLVVRISGEGLRLLSGNCGVALDQSRHYTASSFNTQRQWGNIEKQKILNGFRFVAL